MNPGSTKTSQKLSLPVSNLQLISILHNFTTTPNPNTTKIASHETISKTFPPSLALAQQQFASSPWFVRCWVEPKASTYVYRKRMETWSCKGEHQGTLWMSCASQCQIKDRDECLNMSHVNTIDINLDRKMVKGSLSTPLPFVEERWPVSGLAVQCHRRIDRPSLCSSTLKRCQGDAIFHTDAMEQTNWVEEKVSVRFLLLLLLLFPSKNSKQHAMQGKISLKNDWILQAMTLESD